MKRPVSLLPPEADRPSCFPPSHPMQVTYLAWIGGPDDCPSALAPPRPALGERYGRSLPLASVALRSATRNQESGRGPVGWPPVRLDHRGCSAEALIWVGDRRQPVYGPALAQPTDAVAIRNVGAHLQRGDKEALAGGLDGSVVDHHGAMPDRLLDTPFVPAVWKRLSSPHGLVRGWFPVPQRQPPCRAGLLGDGDLRKRHAYAVPLGWPTECNRMRGRIPSTAAGGNALWPTICRA